jgi:hypothetical protein
VRTLIMVFILAMHLVGPVNGLSGVKRTLAGVFEPEMMTIADSNLYIVEGTHVLIYSLKDLRLIKKIGGPGAGPGEFKPADYWYNTVTVLPDQIFIDGFDKTAYFSKDGQLLREAKKPIGLSRMVPIGDHFAAVKLEHLEGDVQYHCLFLFDANGNSLKEICRQESPVQQMTRKMEMIPDVLNFAVWEDKLFVEKSREGFVLEIFNSRRDRLCRIEKKIEKIPVTKTHENDAIEAFKTDPFLKRLGFEEFKRLSTFVWPKSLPPIKDFTVADGKIYVRTSLGRDGKENWLILDLKGKTLLRADMPRLDNAPLLATLNGVHYYAVHQNKLYFLKDNEKTDEWELFIEEFPSNR